MTYILVTISLALCLIAYKADISFYSKNSFPVLAAFCFVVFYSTCGQVVLFLNGNDIYSGVRVDSINQSIIICIVAQSALVSSSYAIYTILPTRIIATQPVKIGMQPNYNLSGSLLLCLTCALAVLGFRNAGLAFLPKDIKLSQVGSLHYALLLIWQVSYVVNLSNDWKITRRTLICLLTFSAYCILMSERDFIFSATAAGLIAIKGHPQLKKLSIFFILLMAGSAVYLSSGRGGNFDATLFVSALSQGSNLFVNSYVYDYISASGDFFYGKSYLDAFLSTISFGFMSPKYSMSDWLVYMYAGPNSTSGYGFSLEGEAYLNFGFAGVFVVFFCLGSLISYGIKRGDTGGLIPKVVSVWTIVFLFYQVRQESLVVIKTLWLCIFVAMVLKLAEKPILRLSQ